MQTEILLLDDVEHLGRKGEIVRVRSGYSRNFLFPKRFAIVADANARCMQAKLIEERSKKAEADKAESEALAAKIQDVVISVEVKVDPEGHMYGSVSAQDIAQLLAKEGFSVEKKNIVIAHGIKTVGEHNVQLKLKEGVRASIRLQVNAEGAAKAQAE